VSEHAWLEPISAAAAVAANPPPLTEWEAGEGEGEVVAGEVEKLLCELGWPTRTKTFTVPVTVFGSTPHRNEWTETTNRYFPASWLVPLTDHVAKYVQARDADQNPEVPDRLRLRKLPQSADFNALRDIIEGAWHDAWDELACSVAVMPPDDAIGMDYDRYNLAVLLWEGFPSGVDLGLVETGDGTEPRQGSRETLSFEQRMSREEEDRLAGLRELPSPKWRAWFLDTWNDRIAIHHTLERCGVAVTGRLGVDLVEAAYALDMDVTRMTIEELVSRIDARHRFLASAFRAASEGVYRDEPRTEGAGFTPRRTSNRPPYWNELMELVARLRRDNVRWKEIAEEVEKTYGYRSDSGDALRKLFERWQKCRKPPA
jgi:hypothetical protein